MSKLFENSGSLMLVPDEQNTCRATLVRWRVAVALFNLLPRAEYHRAHLPRPKQTVSLRKPMVPFSQLCRTRYLPQIMTTVPFAIQKKQGKQNVRCFLACRSNLVVGLPGRSLRCCHPAEPRPRPARGCRKNEEYEGSMCRSSSRTPATLCSSQMNRIRAEPL